MLQETLCLVLDVLKSLILLCQRPLHPFKYQTLPQNITRILFAVEKKNTFRWLRRYWLLAMVCSGPGFSQGNEMSGIWRFPQFHDGGEIHNSAEEKSFSFGSDRNWTLPSRLRCHQISWGGSCSNQTEQKRFRKVQEINLVLPLIEMQRKRWKQNNQNRDCLDAIRLGTDRGVIRAKAAPAQCNACCLKQSGGISVTSYHQTISLYLSLVRETLKKCKTAFSS